MQAEGRFLKYITVQFLRKASAGMKSAISYHLTRRNNGLFSRAFAVVVRSPRNARFATVR